MNIIDNVFGGTEFRRIKTGATFKYGERYYMKIDEVLYYGNPCNAVCLTNGTLELIEGDKEVNPFMAELKVM